MGIAPFGVGRVWHERALKPHHTKTFKLPNDNDFDRKFWHSAGLYLASPRRQWCFSATSGRNFKPWNALSRRRPVGMGHVRTKTYDYVPHGKISLVAAMH